MRHLISAIFLPIFATTILAQDGDTAKSAIDAARKAAKDAGVQLPEVKKDDVDQLIRRVAEEVEKAKSKKDGDKKDSDPAAETKPGSDPEAPSIRIEKLPDWIPAIPGFKPAGLGRQWEGPVQTGKLKGTSSSTPVALAEAWSKLDGKEFTAERTTRTAGGKTREQVKLVKSGEAERWVELQAEPGAEGQPTAVRVTYAQPPTPAPPKDK